jgi:hypothetical protein
MVHGEEDRKCTYNITLTLVRIFDTLPLLRRTCTSATAVTIFLTAYNCAHIIECYDRAGMFQSRHC